MHAAGHYLNPEFFYSNPAILDDQEVVSDFDQCLQRLVPDEQMQDKISDELPYYKRTEETFGIPIAIRQRGKKAPGKTLVFYVNMCMSINI